MTAPRVDWRKGGPEDGLAVIDVRSFADLTPEEAAVHRAVWDEAMADPAFVAGLEAGKADFAAGRWRKWSDVKRKMQPDPDPLHTDADTTGYHPDIAAIRRRHGMDREPSRSGMVVLYGALAIAFAVLAIAYLWTRAQS